MAELRASQFYNGNITSVNPAKTTVYTVPTGRRIIVRSIAMRNLAAVNNTLYVFVGGVLVHSEVHGAGGSASDSGEWRPWVVVDEGESLQLACSSALGFGVVVSGADHYI